jgi:Xaa-Pro aminopeptidase
MTELEQRREKLFSMMRDYSVAVIFSGVSKIASEDEFYPFVVNNNFFYLTGVTQEHSALIMIKALGEKKCYLFIDEYDELKEKWTGRRLTFEEAEQLSGLQNIYSSANFDNMLHLALTNENNQFGAIKNIYIDLAP